VFVLPRVTPSLDLFGHAEQMVTRFPAAGAAPG
jgi:hypothetical protein